MDQQVQSDLDEIIVLLEADGSSWVRLFVLARQALAQGHDKACSTIILSGSGGMGSLNDIVLGQGLDEKGRWAWKPEYQALNDQFQRLLRRLYVFAEKTSRS